LGLTTVDLFRLGNASGPQMENVRPKDITHFTRNGVVWVKAGQGGISTFSTPPAKYSGRIWKLDAGYDHGTLLLVWNDHAQHWSWEPVADMPLSAFKAELSIANPNFY
jgi:hypothetical protein